MANEDYCSSCARPFQTSDLNKRGSELLCDDCVAGRVVEDPEAEAIKQRLGRRLRWPLPVDLAASSAMAVALGLGWVTVLSPLSIWWCLFLAAAPISCGVYLKARCDTDNVGTMLWSIIVGSAVPIAGFAGYLAANGSALWITLFLIPFGAATSLVAVVGLRR